MDDKTAAALIAEAERLRDSLEATRVLLRDTNGVLRRTADDTSHIRKVVDKLDGLVAEVTVKIRAIKVPKWLGGIAQLADADHTSTER